MKRFAIAAALTLSTAAHGFCGFYVGKADAKLFNEASQVIVVRDGERTVVSMLNDYQGDLKEFAGSPNDVYALAAKVARQRMVQPALYACCGTEDFLIEDNRRFREHAEQVHLPITYEEAPGEHEWGFWDRYIQRVLDWLPVQK